MQIFLICVIPGEDFNLSMRNFLHVIMLCVMKFLSVLFHLDLALPLVKSYIFLAVRRLKETRLVDRLAEFNAHSR